MGEINFGIPKKEVLFLKNSLNLDVFVEGGTAKEMSKHFNKVYTIENSFEMHKIAQQIYLAFQM